MKKIVLTLVVVLACVFSMQAQVWIGGSVNARFGKENKTFTIAPDVGYSFPDIPFSIGCALEYGGTFSDVEPFAHSLTVSPYFRYNLCDINERFSLFLDLCTDFDVLKFASFDVGLAPGVSFDLTDHWSAEFSLGLLEYKWERVPDDKPKHSFELNFKAAAPSFSLYYNF